MILSTLRKEGGNDDIGLLLEETERKREDDKLWRTGCALFGHDPEDDGDIAVPGMRMKLRPIRFKYSRARHSQAGSTATFPDSAKPCRRLAPR